MANKLTFIPKRQYSFRLFVIHTKYRLREVVDFCKEKKSIIDTIKFPERLRGTLVEKWADYWKNLSIDYAEVCKDTVKICREKPTRTLFLVSVAGVASYLASTNPDQVSHRDAFIKWSNKMSLIGPSVQNPRAVNYLRNVEGHYNQGTIRSFSLGVLSIMWLDDYVQNMGIYKANCQYTKPRYWSMYERILDIGFLDKWWIMDRNMEDYDINPSEWPEMEKN